MSGNPEKSYRITLLVLICIISIEPWVVWGLPFILLTMSATYIVSRLIVGSGYFKFEILIPIIIYFYLAFPRGELIDLKPTFLLSVLFLSVYLTEPHYNKIIVFKKVYSLYAWILIPGLIVYTLLFVITLPNFIIPGRNPDLVEFYRNYIFYVFPTSDIDLLPRFRAIFDEAGVVGNVSFLLLFFKEFKLRTWKDWIILTSGLVSFSLFFYVASLLSVFLINITSFKKLLYRTLVILVFYIVFVNLEFFQVLIFERITIYEKLIGENRTQDIFNDGYEKLINSSDLFFGKGMGSVEDLFFRDAAIASYKSFVYQYGIIGIILLFISYLYIIRRRLDARLSLLVMIAIGLVFYQRQWIFVYYFSIIVFSGIEIMRFNKKNENE